MERFVSIRNTSRSLPIIISLSSANFLEVSDKLIPPSSAQTVSVKGGIRDLRVQKEHGNTIWKGFIPVKVNEEILISPEKLTVRYRGISLPRLQDTTIINAKKSYVYLVLIIILIAIALGGSFYYLQKN